MKAKHQKPSEGTKAKQSNPLDQLAKSKLIEKKKLLSARKIKIANCFVKLDRKDVDNKIAEMKRLNRTTPQAGARPKKVVATGMVQKRRASPVMNKPNNKASPVVVKSTNKASPVMSKSINKASPVGAKSTNKASPVVSKSADKASPVVSKSTNKASPVVSKTTTKISPQVTKVASKAAPALTKSAVKAVKSIIAGRDRALLKDTGTIITSKRTPKPNRRYINEHTVNKVVATASSENESREDDDDVSDVEEEVSKKDIKLNKKLDSDNDWSEEEELLVESPAARRRHALDAKSEPAKKRGRPPKEIFARKVVTVQKSKEVPAVAPKLTGLNKRKLDLNTSDAGKVQIKKKMRQERSPSPTDDSSDESDDMPASPPRLRKQIQTKNVPLRKPLQAERIPTPTQPSKSESSNQLAVKRSALSATLKQKLNTSAPGPQDDRGAKTTITKSSISANCTPINSPKFYGRKRVSTQPTASAQNSPSPVKTKPVHVEPVDLEDFEQMPTFTIVNINDIINQKDEVVVIQKKGKAVSVKRKAAQIEEDDVEYEPSVDSMDDDDLPDTNNKNRSHISRRKAVHTSIRSEKSKANPNTTPPKILNNTVGRPYRNIIKQNGRKSPILVPSPKGAPRILNSTLCRNSSTVQPRVLNDTLNNNNVANNRTKGNVVRTFSNPRAGLAAKQPPPPTKTVISQQIVQGGTTRRVRKITCFETWFVIKLPAEEQHAHMAELALSLVKLGNDIGQVPLPSDQWSYNISLLRKANIYQRASSANNDDEVYTGEVQDISIKPEERHMYVPTNIMFRRKSQNPTLRMQFDRAVIFKNKKFYINIEGKNVKLLAAPAVLDCLSDIETLLQIVNELSLRSPLVEQTSYIA